MDIPADERKRLLAQARRSANAIRRKDPEAWKRRRQQSQASAVGISLGDSGVPVTNQDMQALNAEAEKIAETTITNTLGLGQSRKLHGEEKTMDAGEIERMVAKERTRLEEDAAWRTLNRRFANKHHVAEEAKHDAAKTRAQDRRLGWQSRRAANVRWKKDKFADEEIVKRLKAYKLDNDGQTLNTAIENMTDPTRSKPEHRLPFENPATVYRRLKPIAHPLRPSEFYKSL